MSRIRGSNTLPEMQIRRGLHARGLRYRLHDRRLPGSPDIVFARHRAVVFVHGCFWHVHGCHLSKMPASRQEFWRAKLEMNRARDRKAVTILRSDGWRVLTIWECAVRGSGRRDQAEVLRAAERFISNCEVSHLEIIGKCPPPLRSRKAQL
jgi:DNA mismatch endonuclease (patch repair protein)